MCYSAMIWADYRRYVREWGADIDIKRFVEARRGGRSICASGHTGESGQSGHDAGGRDLTNGVVAKIGDEYISASVSGRSFGRGKPRLCADSVSAPRGSG